MEAHADTRETPNHGTLFTLNGLAECPTLNESRFFRIPKGGCVVRIVGLAPEVQRGVVIIMIENACWKRD